MKPKNIVIFGNTNNYPLLLAEGLKSLGHNVKLLFNRPECIHRPESKYADWKGSYPSWIYDVSDITDVDIAFETGKIDKVKKLLTYDVDLVILNDIGPSLIDYINVPHIVLLTGSDLTYYADFKILKTMTHGWDSRFKRSSEGRKHIRMMAQLIMRQRDGILSAKKVSFALRDLVPEGDELLDEIGISDEYRLMMFLSNVNGLKLSTAPKNKVLRILCGSRIVFNRKNNPYFSTQDFKGTDLLIYGFAEYCRLGGRGALTFFEKGQDVDEAKLLINELKINNRVHWLPEMTLVGFTEEMLKSDLICDQFGTSFPGMVSLDAYALGRPVMANLRNEVFSSLFSDPLPGFNVTTKMEIANTLLEIDSNPGLLEKKGLESRKYAEDYLSPKKMAAMLLENVFRR